MDRGVLRDYVHKRSDGTKPIADIPCTIRGKTKRARKKEANEKRRREASGRKEKEKAKKRGKLEHYFAMERTAY